MHLPVSLRLIEVPRDDVPLLEAMAIERIGGASATIGIERKRQRSAQRSARTRPQETGSATGGDGSTRSRSCLNESVLVDRQIHKCCFQ